MVNRDLAGVPECPPPPGYRLRWYQPGDEREWTRIHRLADELTEVSDDLFPQRFGTDPVRLGERQCYLEEGGEVVGTATAWFDDRFEGERWGRVHWVAVVPSRQGKGYARLLVSAVCRRIRELGDSKAYLATQPERWRAVRLYRGFGFEPLIRNASEEALWRLVRERA